MDFCSGADVGEDDKAIVLKQNICWRLLCYNPTIQAIVKGEMEEEKFIKANVKVIVKVKIQTCKRYRRRRRRKPSS